MKLVVVLLGLLVFSYSQVRYRKYEFMYIDLVANGWWRIENYSCNIQGWCERAAFAALTSASGVAADRLEQNIVSVGFQNILNLATCFPQAGQVVMFTVSPQPVVEYWSNKFIEAFRAYPCS